MNFIILIFSLLLIRCQGVQSQDVSSSHMYSNRIYLNPALTGVEHDERRVFLNYRNQWPGIGNSFVSYTASYDQYIKSLQGGVGFKIFNDAQANGAIQEFSLAVDYSYHMQLSHKFFLNAGFEAGFVQKSLKTSGFVLSDMIDPVTGESSGFSAESFSDSKVFYPDFAIGLSGFYEKYYGGVSVSHILKPFQHEISSNNSRIPRKVIVFVGAMIPIYEKRLGKEVLQLSPNIIYQQQKDFSQLNYGLDAVIQNQLLTGIALRQNLGIQFSSLIFSVGYITNSYRIRYSYDQMLSSPTIQLPNMGAHEISFILIMQSGKKKKHQAIKCPKI